MSREQDNSHTHFNDTPLYDQLRSVGLQGARYLRG